MASYNRAISTPIVSSASFFYKDSQEAEDIFSGNSSQFLYARMGNPTSAILEEKLSKMENGVGAISTSSGMAAITMVVMSLCSLDDEVIAVGGLFGGSYALMSKTLPRFGIQAKFFAVDDLENIENSITSKTKIIFCESIGNPSLRLPDLEAIGKIATRHNVVFIVDNTITPIIVKPFEYGADIVVYSTTKIISGNSSALGGIAIFKAVQKDDKFHTSKYDFLKPFITKLQGKALIGCAKKRALRDFGMSANANSSYQTILGLETLELRNNRINTSCAIIAKILKSEGLNVNHPSLKENIDNKLYNKNFKEGCGSMLTIDMGSKERAFNFLDSSKFLIITANIGDSRTLGLHMGSTIYQDFTSEEKKFLGITEGLIRISVGLEKPEDIIDDLLDCFKASK